MKLVFGLALAAAGASPLAAVEVGQHEPDWRFTTLDGRTITAAECAGHVVILDFWATWCGPCKREMPRFAALQKKYREQGLLILGVSIDGSAGAVRKYLAEHPAGYTVGMSNDQVYTAFNYPDVVPTTFLIDRQGIVRDRQLGEISAAGYEKKVAACLTR